MQITLAFCIDLILSPFNTFQFHLYPTNFLRKCKFNLNVDYLNLDFRNLGWGGRFFAPSYRKNDSIKIFLIFSLPLSPLNAFQFHLHPTEKKAKTT